MSSLLVGLVKRCKFGDHRATWKLALWALADAASDAGDLIGNAVSDLADIAELTEGAAQQLLADLCRTGALVEVHRASAEPTLRLNVPLLHRLANSDVSYVDLLDEAGR